MSNPVSAALSPRLTTSIKEKKMAGKKPAIRTLVTVIAPLLAAVVLSLSCKQTDRYSFWKGTIENYYYILDMNDQRLHKVAGKPYMVMEYDPLNGYPLRV
ncbi:hypothetical protein JXD38_00820 [candidate division WOR-3 bacterium]|nr:hypothetical protein [candidate division WOR-3 bacterium]